MPRKPAGNDDEFEKHERNQEQILWLQDFVFNPAKVPFPTILLVGKRFSGKSYTSVSIAAKFDVPRWAAWCGTKDTEDFWAERFESNATVKGPDEKGKSYLINIIRYQQRKGRLYKRVLNQPFPRKFVVGLIFDDVTSKRQFRKGEILEDLFSNGRHYHAVIIISAQYLKQLPPAVRLNTDYMFMMHNTKRTIKVLYEDYVEEPDEFGMFLDLIRAVTGQKDAQGNDIYNALVYDNVKKTQKLEEIFKIYRNEGDKYLDGIKLGDVDWREYNKAHYKDEEYELQLREHRKNQRMMRLQEYRQQQILRRSQGGVSNPLGPAELDYYDDTDSEDGDSHHDSVTLQHRNGPSVKLNFSKRATGTAMGSGAPLTSATGSDVRWSMPQTSGYGTAAPLPSPPPQQPPSYGSMFPQVAPPAIYNPWQQPQQQQQQPPTTYGAWSPPQPQLPTAFNTTPWQQPPTTYGAWPQPQQPPAAYNPWQPQPQQPQPPYGGGGGGFYRPPAASSYPYARPTYMAPTQPLAYKSPWQTPPAPQAPSWTAQQDFIRTHSLYTPQPGSRFFL